MTFDQAEAVPTDGNMDHMFASLTSAVRGSRILSVVGSPKFMEAVQRTQVSDQQPMALFVVNPNQPEGKAVSESDALSAAVSVATSYEGKPDPDLVGARRRLIEEEGGFFVAQPFEADANTAAAIRAKQAEQFSGKASGKKD